VVQVVAALAAGPLLDRRGARLGLRLGAGCYLASALLFLSSTWLPALVAARLLQGIGIALILPAVLSVVPGLVATNLRGTALGVVGAFNNVALAAGPPLGLLLLRWAPTALFVAAFLVGAIALLLTWSLRVGLRSTEPGDLLHYRVSWTPLYAITFLCVVYWGVVTAFLPIEVPSHQVPNVGWFFTADALAVMATRIPTGYLADRFGPRWLLIIGALLTAVAIVLLLLPASFFSLVFAGIGTGVSAALMFPPILLELTKRSDDRDRGTAMALYNTSFAAAVGAGSLGAAFVVPRFGFGTSLVVSIVCTLAAAPVALATIRTREDL
jgi:MFS family permease